jgi:hypothetical protein
MTARYCHYHDKTSSLDLGWSEATLRSEGTNPCFIVPESHPEQGPKNGILIAHVASDRIVSRKDVPE